MSLHPAIAAIGKYLDGCDVKKSPSGIDRRLPCFAPTSRSPDEEKFADSCGKTVPGRSSESHHVE